jgi:hypothetical protein
MNSRHICSLLFLTCLLTGCFDLTEEYLFNADHSGRYIVTFDLSSVINMSGKTRQSFEKQRDSLIAIGAPQVIDSSFSLLANEPDSLRRLLKHPELFARSTGRMLLDYNKKQILMQTIYEFKNIAELQQMQREWQEYQHTKDSLKALNPPAVKSRSSDLPASDDFQGMVSEYLPEIRYEGRKFSMQYRLTPGKNGNNDFSEIMNDESAFGRNILKSFKYNLILHFPKSVKKADGEGFTVTGNTVSCKSNFLELMKTRDKGLNVEVKLAR